MTIKSMRTLEPDMIDIHATVVNTTSLYILLYFIMGFITVSYINNMGDNIFVILAKAGFSNRAQGVFAVILVTTWPIWFAIMVYSYIMTFVSNPPEVDNE